MSGQGRRGHLPVASGSGGGITSESWVESLEEGEEGRRRRVRDDTVAE